MDPDKTPTPTPESRQQIIALTIIYLNAIQNGPGTTDENWAAAQELKERLAAELPQ